LLVAGVCLKCSEDVNVQGSFSVWGMEFEMESWARLVWILEMFIWVRSSWDAAAVVGFSGRQGSRSRQLRDAAAGTSVLRYKFTWRLRSTSSSTCHSPLARTSA